MYIRFLDKTRKFRLNFTFLLDPYQYPWDYYNIYNKLSMIYS